MNKRNGSSYSFFNNMVWPNRKGLGSLDYKLRYERQSLTESDLLFAASIVSAYESLLSTSQKNCNYIIQEIKKGES